MAEVVTTVGGVSYVVGDVARVADLTWSTGWPYGCLEASFTVDLGPNSGVPAALRKGADVAIWDGPACVWSGYLSELETGSPWTVHAQGYYALLTNYLCLSSTPTPAPTSIPQTAVTEAITRGLPITLGAALPTTPFAAVDETIATNTVFSLIEAYAASIGQRWGVDENRVLTLAADPTTPDLYLMNTEAIRGTADDEYVTDIYPRYVSGVTGTDPTAWGLGHVGVISPPAGRREAPLDLTTLGLMTDVKANSMAQGRLDLGGARMGYTSGLEVSYGELAREGGAPVRLGLVKGRQMFRAFTVADAGGQVVLGMTQDVVIGRTQYADGESTIQLQPVDMAARSLSDVLATPPSPPEVFDGTAAA